MPRPEPGVLSRSRSTQGDGGTTLHSEREGWAWKRVAGARYELTSAKRCPARRRYSAVGPFSNVPGSALGWYSSPGPSRHATRAARAAAGLPADRRPGRGRTEGALFASPPVEPAVGASSVQPTMICRPRVDFEGPGRVVSSRRPVSLCASFFAVHLVRVMTCRRPARCRASFFAVHLARVITRSVEGLECFIVCQKQAVARGR